MKGAVQGAATTTANTPDSKASAKGCRANCAAKPLAQAARTCSTPNKFKAIRVNNNDSTTTTQGDCN